MVAGSLENFISILLYLTLGVIFNRLKIFPKESSNVLNIFVIYVSLPAIVLLKIPELEITYEIITPILSSWFVIFFSIGIVLLLSKALKWDRALTGCMLLMVPLGNTSFLGLPMIKTFFGDRGLPFGLIYDQFGSFFGLAIYGSIILSIYSSDSNKIDYKNIIIKIITFPPFITLIAALLLSNYAYPVIALNILETLSLTLIPVVMIAVGLQLEFKLDNHEIIPLFLALFIKLLLAPVILLFVYKMVGIKGEMAEVSVFESAMPPMISAGALAIMAKLYSRLTASLIGLGILLSFLTLPVVYFLIKYFL